METNRNLTRKKAKIANRLIREIEEGKVILDPVELVGKPTHVQLTHIGDPQEYRGELDETSDLTEFNQALKSQKNLQKYLENSKTSKLVLSPAEIVIDLGQENIPPTLSSFHFDKRIIIKPVKDCEEIFQIHGYVTYQGFSTNFSLNKSISLSTKSERAYRSIEIENAIGTSRGKIYWSLNQSKTNLEGSLAFETLTHQLEPTTSSRIARLYYSLPKNKRSQEEFYKVSSKSAYEEGLVAKAVTKTWMIKNKEQNNLEVGDILNFNPRLETSDDYKAIQQIQRSGANVAIHYYGDKCWNLDKFLDGSFVK